MSDTDGKLIKTILEGPLSVQFEEIKSFYGLANSSEVVRFLISQEYRRVQADQARLVVDFPQVVTQ